MTAEIVLIKSHNNPNICHENLSESCNLLSITKFKFLTDRRTQKICWVKWNRAKTSVNSINIWFCGILRYLANIFSALESLCILVGKQHLRSWILGQNKRHHRVAYYFWGLINIKCITAWGDYLGHGNCLIRSSSENLLSVENKSIKRENIFDMKISQAVLLLASNSAGEKVVLDKTRQIDIGPSEDGARTGNG